MHVHVCIVTRGMALSLETAAWYMSQHESGHGWLSLGYEHCCPCMYMCAMAWDGPYV